MEPMLDTRKEPPEGFVRPGFGLVRGSGGQLWSVVGSSVTVTLYDRKRRLGGMTHYVRPVRPCPEQSTPFFAAPAIIWLARQFLDSGSQSADMEAQLIGGACDLSHPDCIPGLHERNVAVGLEILQKLRIWVSTMDVGGDRGRKVVFNPVTGETAIARVTAIRQLDWYPPLETA
jgi:chemotaxis protein CheD